MTAAHHEKGLSRFETPDALVAFFTTRGGDLDEKDIIYATLVRAVQARTELSDLATPLLWLGLWPGLDAIYRRHLRYFRKEPGELVARIAFIFTTMVSRLDLGGVNRLASTLLLNVQRDLRTGLKRRRIEVGREVDVEELADTLRDPRPLISERTLRVDAGCPADACAWLAPIVGDDAYLVVGATIYGVDSHELADQLGISHEAARKRYQRAVRRIRSEFK